MRTSLEDRVVAYIIARGGKEVQTSGSKRFRQFTRIPGQSVPGTYYFVDHFGNVRIGFTSTKTMNITRSFHNAMHLWEEQHA